MQNFLDGINNDLLDARLVQFVVRLLFFALQVKIGFLQRHLALLHVRVEQLFLRLSLDDGLLHFLLLLRLLHRLRLSLFLFLLVIRGNHVRLAVADGLQVVIG